MSVTADSRSYFCFKERKLSVDSRRGSCQLLLIQGEEVVSYCCFKERKLSVTADPRRGSCQLLLIQGEEVVSYC